MRVRYQRLPTGYREVEYLESTGTQYINCNINSGTSNILEADIQFKDTTTSQLNGADYGVYFGIYNNQFVSSALASLSPIKNADTQKHHFKAIINTNSNTNTFYIDGDSYTSNRTSSYNTYGFYIFAISQNTSYFCKEKVYNFKITKDGTLVRNFIPCIRTSDSKPGLYDIVNSQFYTNAGTGEFLYGPYFDYCRTSNVITEGTTNLCASISPARYSGWSSITFNKIGDNSYRLKNSSTATEYWDSWGYDVSAYIGQVITFSATIKNMTTSDATTKWIAIGQANTSQYPNHLPSSGTGNYVNYNYETANNKRISWSGTLQSPGRVLIEVWTSKEGSVGYSQLDVDNIQIELKNHATPYTPNTRANNSPIDCTPHMVYAEGTTNLSQVIGVGGWDNSGTSTRRDNDKTINAPEQSCPIYSITQLTTGQSAIKFGTTSLSVPSKTLTASVWFYMSGTHTGTSNIGPYIRSNKNDSNVGNLTYNGSTDFRNWPNNRWLKLTKTFTTSSSETTLYFCAYTANADEKFYFNGWQIEEKDHATMYVKGTRPNNTII